MYNVPAFRAFMKELIGDRTQLEFAAEKGITSVHLSRMMRSEKPPRPSKDTLKKIAGGSDGVYEELLSLCGYRGEETQVILSAASVLDQETILNHLRESVLGLHHV